MKIVAIDFETANRYPASICAIGIATMEDGAVEETFYSLVKPNQEVSFFSRGNIMVHGIRPEDVEDAPTFKEIFLRIEPLFKDAIIVAHNANFDITCLKEACALADLTCPSFSYVDTVRLSRKAFPSLEHHRLNDVCQYCGIELNHHNALSDAYGCLLVVAQIMNLANVFDLKECCAILGVNAQSTAKM